MKRKHEEQREKLAQTLDSEARKEEQALMRQMEAQREQAMREKRNKQAAERAAHGDMSQEQLAAVRHSLALRF